MPSYALGCYHHNNYDCMCQFSGIGNPPVEESKSSSGNSRACVFSHHLLDVDYRTLGDSLMVVQPHMEHTDTESNDLFHRGQGVDH